MLRRKTCFLPLSPFQYYGLLSSHTFVWHMQMKTHDSWLAWKKSDLSLISRDTLEWLLEKSFFSLSFYESNRQQITNIQLTNVMQRQHTYIDLAFATNPHDRQVIINIFTFKWLSLCLNTQTRNWIDPAIYQRRVWWWNSSLMMNLSWLYIWGNKTTEFSLMKKLDTLHNLMI